MVQSGGLPPTPATLLSQTPSPAERCKRIENHFSIRLSQIANLLVSSLSIQVRQTPKPSRTRKRAPSLVAQLPLGPPSLSPLSPHPPEAWGGGRASQPHIFLSELCLLHFTGRVNTSPLRAEKKEITQPRCRQCSPVCQREERREIKANKTSKSQIPKPPLGYLAAVKVNTGTWRRGEPIPNKMQAAVECGIHRPTRLHFQACDRRPHGPIFSANVQVACLDCGTKTVFSEN